MSLLVRNNLKEHHTLEKISSDLINHIPAAVYVCDASGFIQYYNTAAVELWGREPELGRDLWCGSWKIFTSSGDKLALADCPMAVTLKEKRAVTGEEIIIERPDGGRRIILPYPKPLYDNRGVMIGAINMLVDITDSKRMKELNCSIDKCNAQMDEFAAAASHDLQEPLRKIRTFTSLLKIKQAEVLNDEGNLLLDKVFSSTERMSNIVHDLVAYTRYSYKPGSREQTDLNTIIEETKDELELLIEEKDVKIQYKNLPVIYADSAQISRLFYNIISNSIKFCKEDNICVVSVSCKKHPENFDLIFTDNGIGFDMKHADHIFNIFYRLPNKKHYEGNGIGLSICKKIVENYNGLIDASSEPGKYTSIRVRFPNTMLVA